MSDETSARLVLPLIAAGQAQKELSHNEALALLDLAVQPVVVAVGTNTPPTAPAPGDCWIVGMAPTGAWTGRAGALAGWTAGGWRFVAARDGMTAWSVADGATARFSTAGWVVGEVRGSSLVLGGDAVVGVRRSAIPAASGGTTIDAEARVVISAMLDALRGHGLIAS